MVPRTSAVATKSSTTLNMVFGNKKTKAQKAADEEKAAQYWQGEWVCKDCGYIYNRVSVCLCVCVSAL
jgi:rubrerythrin